MPRVTLRQRLIKASRNKLEEDERVDKEIIKDIEYVNAIADLSGEPPVISDVSAIKDVLEINRSSSDEHQKLKYLERHRYLNPRTKVPKSSNTKEMLRFIEGLDSERFRQNMVGMGKVGFEALYQLIKDHPEYQRKPRGRPPWPVKEHMMIALRKLILYGNGAKKGTVAQQYSCGGKVYLNGFLAVFLQLVFY